MHGVCSDNVYSTTVNVVMINRLVYRKGVDLAVEVVPRLCDLFPNVHFIIGASVGELCGRRQAANPQVTDAVRRWRRVKEAASRRNAGAVSSALHVASLLRAAPAVVCLTRLRGGWCASQLHDRVELLGAVPHSQVPHVLRRGHIFLNCSLTEAFCIAIVEAARYVLVCLRSQARTRTQAISSPVYGTRAHTRCLTTAGVHGGVGTGGWVAAAGCLWSAPASGAFRRCCGQT